MNRIYGYFDRLEDRVRGALSKRPIAYSVIGGIGVVLFWRSVWTAADSLAAMHPVFAWLFDPFVQLVVSTLGLMLTGIMVSMFIGDRIILSGLRHEKKLEERTGDLVKEEVVTLEHLRAEIRSLRKEVESMKPR